MVHVTVSGNQTTEIFYLSDHTDIASLDVAISNIAYRSDQADMTSGLQLMRTEVFNETNGDRSQVRNVAILLTDGIPTHELDQLLAEVQRTKDSGIRVVAVGLTDAVSSEWTNIMLRQVSHCLFTDHLWSEMKCTVARVTICSKMVNGSRYYRALESVSIASALSSALTIYPCQIRVHQTLTVLNFQLLTARKKFVSK